MQRLTIAALLVVFVGAACQDGPVEPVQETAATAPALNFTNGPGDPGPQIFRFEDAFFIRLVDTKRGLQAFAGIDIVDVCSGNFDPDLADFQVIVSPADAGRYLQLAHGEDLAGSAWGFTESDCGRILAEEPLAEGPVDLRKTDNDFAAFSRENQNWNAFGTSVHGAFSGHVRCRWDGNDPATLECHDAIIVP